jgi:hypothetical protein
VYKRQDLDHLIKKTKAGEICYTVEEAVILLRRLCNEYLSNKELSHNPDRTAIAEYSRKNQTAKLAAILNSISQKKELD